MEAIVAFFVVIGLAIAVPLFVSRWRYPQGIATSTGLLIAACILAFGLGAFGVGFVILLTAEATDIPPLLLLAPSPVVAGMLGLLCFRHIRNPSARWFALGGAAILSLAGPPTFIFFSLGALALIATSLLFIASAAASKNSVTP